jgi:ABC-type multidrug transport system ATPase subunit
MVNLADPTTADASGAGPGALAGPVVDVEDLHRSYGKRVALRGVSLQIEAGEIHAILGPNGAGKTTLLRTLSGLQEPDAGEVWIHGLPWDALSEPRHRNLLGLAPSGDRSFYLRISGLENLAFFARLHGLNRRAAVELAWKCLREVELEEAAKVTVGAYSHGMQKRLSFARAILAHPPVLMIDEATHDLDPPSAERIRELTRERARAGAAVLWATQRVDEIRGLADRVTLLNHGVVKFQGTVPELMAAAPSRAYLLQLRDRDERSDEVGPRAAAAVETFGTVVRPAAAEGEHHLLTLHDKAVLGEAIGALQGAGIDVLACREERSQVEVAFLTLTGGAE